MSNNLTEQELAALKEICPEIIRTKFESTELMLLQTHFQDDSIRAIARRFLDMAEKLMSIEGYPASAIHVKSNSPFGDFKECPNCLEMKKIARLRKDTP